MPGGKRFDPKSWAARLTPWILGLIVLALLVMLVVLGMSLMGLTPE